MRRNAAPAGEHGGGRQTSKLRNLDLGCLEEIKFISLLPASSPLNPLFPTEPSPCTPSLTLEQWETALTRSWPTSPGCYGPGSSSEFWPRGRIRLTTFAVSTLCSSIRFSLPLSLRAQIRGSESPVCPVRSLGLFDCSITKRKLNAA